MHVGKIQRGKIHCGKIHLEKIHFEKIHFGKIHCGDNKNLKAVGRGFQKTKSIYF